MEFDKAVHGEVILRDKELFCLCGAFFGDLVEGVFAFMVPAVGLAFGKPTAGSLG